MSNNQELKTIEQEIKSHLSHWEARNALFSNQEAKYEFIDWGTPSNDDQPQQTSSGSPPETCICSCPATLPSPGARLCKGCKLWHKECSETDPERMCENCVTDQIHEEMECMGIINNNNKKQAKKNRNKRKYNKVDKEDNPRKTNEPIQGKSSTINIPRDEVNDSTIEATLENLNKNVSSLAQSMADIASYARSKLDNKKRRVWCTHCQSFTCATYLCKYCYKEISCWEKVAMDEFNRPCNKCDQVDLKSLINRPL